jgi:hypothetical protein
MKRHFLCLIMGLTVLGCTSCTERGANSTRSLDKSVVHEVWAEILRNPKRAVAVQRDAINARDQDWETLLHFAARSGEADIVTALLHAGANVDAQDFLGITPLMLAASYGHSDVVDLLLRAGADAEKRDRNGESALHYAAFGTQIRPPGPPEPGGEKPELSEDALLYIKIKPRTLEDYASSVEQLVKAGAPQVTKNRAATSAYEIARNSGLTNVLHLLDPSPPKR